ncbi:MAG: hypothetical protein AAF352_04500, partial [Pseudomonadota bacterium]
AVFTSATRILPSRPGNTAVMIPRGHGQTDSITQPTISAVMITNEGRDLSGESAGARTSNNQVAQAALSSNHIRIDHSGQGHGDHTISNQLWCAIIMRTSITTHIEGIAA